MTAADRVDPATSARPTERKSPSAARERLLATADSLFYSEGIRAVGVDRLVVEASVTRMTFYRHFPSKEDLIVADLNRRSQAEQRRFAAARAATPERARSAFRGVIAYLSEELSQPGFRGCPYANAAAEYSDPQHPVRLAVAAHREWFRSAIAQLVADIGHPTPMAAADQLVILRDGAMVATYLSDSDAVAEALRVAGRAIVVYNDQAPVQPGQQSPEPDDAEA